MHLEAGKQLRRDPWFLIGAVLFICLVGLAVFGPVWGPMDPYDISYVPLSPPSTEHWLGSTTGEWTSCPSFCWVCATHLFSG